MHELHASSRTCTPHGASAGRRAERKAQSEPPRRRRRSVGRSSYSSYSFYPRGGRVRPYLQRDGITIYHGDCRSVLPVIGVDPDLVLTDPPYGMGYKPLRGGDGSKRFILGVEGDSEPFDPAHLIAYRRSVLWGANWYANRLPPSGGWLVWDKTPRGAKDGFAASHAELAWSNCCSSTRKFSMQWGGEAHGNEPHYHPTQKPVALMRWIIVQFTAPGDLVLDPYMGSGPVAIACHEEGRRYVGIEINRGYCDIAAGRLSQGLLFRGDGGPSQGGQE